MGSSSKKYKDKESRKRRHHSRSESEEREAPKEKRHRHRRHHKDRKREKPSKSYDYESDGMYLCYYKWGYGINKPHTDMQPVAQSVRYIIRYVHTVRSVGLELTLYSHAIAPTLQVCGLYCSSRTLGRIEKNACVNDPIAYQVLTLHCNTFASSNLGISLSQGRKALEPV